jgi:hypothetical protein
VPLSLSSRWRSFGAAGNSISTSACAQVSVSRVVYDHDFTRRDPSGDHRQDQAPRWQPASLAGVTEAEVERHFAPLATELDLS